jgi:PAS domain S-box-containing protein
MSNNPFGNNADSFEAALRNTKSKKKSIFELKKTYPAFLLLIVTALISVALYFYIDSKVDSDQQLAFDDATEAVSNRISNRYDGFENTLLNMKSLFDNSYVVRDVFESNARLPYESYPAIQGFFRTFESDDFMLDEYIYNSQREGYYDFYVYPEGRRDNYNVIQFFYPFDNNYHLMGYDVATDSVLYSAIQKAKYNEEIVNTPVYEFRKDTSSFFIVAPAFLPGEDIATEEDIESFYDGALMLELNSKQFFENALGAAIATDSSIVYRVYDSDGSNDVVFESDNSKLLDSDYTPLLESTVEIPLSDRSFRVEYYTIPGFGGTFQQYLPLLTLIVSLILSFVLFGFVISVITSRARAEELAERMTRSQRRIMDSSQDIIAVLTYDGTWQSMNPASLKVFEYVPEEMVGKNIKNLIISESDKSHFDNIQNREDNFTDRVDMLMKTHTEKEKWVNWSFTVSKEDKLIYAIGRDVTLEKQQEKQAKIKGKQIQLAEKFAIEAAESKTYFMTKLSHTLRNSLTGTLGYLQLVTGKAYDNEEELDMYVNMANDSSEELFTYVSDIIDMAEQQNDSRHTANIGTINIGDTFGEMKDGINAKLPDTEITTELMDESSSASFIGDKSLFESSLMKALQIMSTGLSNAHFTINAVVNSYEGATEIQIMGPGNQVVERMINIYKNEKNQIIDALEKDEQDLLLDMALLESNIRRMSGTTQLETFGGEEGNIVMMTLPFDKKDPSIG